MSMIPTYILLRYGQIILGAFLIALTSGYWSRRQRNLRLYKEYLRQLQNEKDNAQQYYTFR